MRKTKMKKTLLATLALSLAAIGAYAQGTVTFNNNGGGYRAPVYFPQAGAASQSLLGNTAGGLPAGTQVYTGALLSGSGYTAQLFSGPAGTTDANLLVGATGLVTFRSGSAAGFTSVTTATLANVAKDAASAVFQIRVWDNSSGLYASWAQASTAWNQGLIAAGTGNLFTVNAIGGDLNTPPNLVGQQSFNIYFVPEPGTFVLAGLAAASLLIFRRRK
jgi:hypothetical protein